MDQCFDFGDNIAVYSKVLVILNGLKDLALGLRKRLLLALCAGFFLSEVLNVNPICR